jgi:hypothetical protein
MNFRYTIEMALKNAIIGDIFVGQAQKPLQKNQFFVKKKDDFQWPMSPG